MPGRAVRGWAAAQSGVAHWRESIARGDESRRLGKYVEARQSYQEALAEAEKFGPDDQRLAATLNNLAALLFDYGNASEAEASVPARARNLRAGRNRRAMTTWPMCSIISRPSPPGAAASRKHSLSTEGLSILVDKDGSDGPGTAAVLNNMADVVRRLGRNDEAESLYKRSIAAWRKGDKGKSGEALAMGNLAALYFSQARYDEAQSLLEQCLRMQTALLGPEHPRLANNMTHLGEIYLVRHRYAEAEDLFRHSLAIKEKALAPDHPDLLMTLSALGRLLMATDRSDEAGALFERAQRIARKSLPAGNPELGALLVNIGRYHRLQGRLADAQGSLQQGLQILETALGPDHSRTLAAVIALAEVYVAEARYESADAMYRRAMAGLEKNQRPRCRAGGSHRQPRRHLPRSRPRYGGGATVPARAAHVEIAVAAGRVCDEVARVGRPLSSRWPPNGRQGNGTERQ